MMKASALACLLALVSAWAAFAQEVPECHANTDYMLIEYKRSNDFSDFLVKTKISPTQEIPCKFDPRPEDFKISELDKTHQDEDRVYRFVAMEGDLLVLEREEGTGITTTYLIMVDLKLRESSDELGTHAGLEKIDQTGVTFWKTTHINPTRKNCPKDYKYDGSAKYEHAQAMIERKVKFDFASREIIESPVTRCVVWAD